MRREIVCAEEVGGNGERFGYLVTLDCGHKKATRVKKTHYECLTCEMKPLMANCGEPDESDEARKRP